MSPLGSDSDAIPAIPEESCATPVKQRLWIPMDSLVRGLSP